MCRKHTQIQGPTNSLYFTMATWGKWMLGMTSSDTGLNYANHLLFFSCCLVTSHSRWSPHILKSYVFDTNSLFGVFFVVFPLSNFNYSKVCVCPSIPTPALSHEAHWRCGQSFSIPVITLEDLKWAFKNSFNTHFHTFLLHLKYWVLKSDF